MINALRRLNDALPELILGILIYGGAAEVIGLIFAGDKLFYTTGLVIGLSLSVFMAIHIALVIEESVRLGEGFGRRLAAKSVIRYLIVAAVLFIMMWLHIGSLIGAFIGIIGLKLSAYAQPILHKSIFKGDKACDTEVLTLKGEVGE